MSEDQLKNLRDELDTIDVEIQNLLTRRAEISLEVKRVKQDGEVKLKPGREAQILRALIERHHGHFPKPELIRIWREILSASLQAQGPFSVGVYAPEDKKNGDDDSWGYFAAARGHFGTYTQMTCYASQRRVIEAVIADECSVGILPLPDRQEDDPWWRYLAVQESNGGSRPPRIISRLPFVNPIDLNGRSISNALDCLVIAKSEVDPSGADCSYFVLDLAENILSSKIDAKLVENGMEGAVVTTWHNDQAPERWLTLIKAEDLILPDDEKFGRLIEEFDDQLNQATILGGYAVPIGADALAPNKNNGNTG